MTQQKKGMPFVSEITKSTQNSTRDRYVQIVGKYTKQFNPSHYEV
jgi:hypothetical protein